MSNENFGPFKVRDLIARLSKLPQDADVYVDGYEGGIQALSDAGIRECGVEPDDFGKDRGWWGTHAEIEGGRGAVVLSRYPSE